MRSTHTTLTVAALLLGLAGGATARGTTPAADVALASWTLEKTGRLDAATSTITWTITPPRARSGTDSCSSTGCWM